STNSSPCLNRSSSDLALASSTLADKRGRALRITVSTTDPKEDVPVKVRLLLVLAFILAVPVISASLSGRNIGPFSPVVRAQCPDGSHGTSGNCVPDQPPVAVPSGSPTDISRCHNSSSSGTTVRGGSGDVTSGLITGLMALGVGLLFWLRMR